MCSNKQSLKNSLTDLVLQPFSRPEEALQLTAPSWRSLRPGCRRSSLRNTRPSFILPRDLGSVLEAMSRSRWAFSCSFTRPSTCMMVSLMRPSARTSSSCSSVPAGDVEVKSQVVNSRYSTGVQYCPKSKLHKSLSSKV